MRRARMLGKLIAASPRRRGLREVRRGDDSLTAMKLKFVLLVLALPLCTPLVLDAQGIGWQVIDAKIRRDFPEVKGISTGELATLLAGREAPLLLDVRTRAEFEVSHLPGARQIEPNADATVLHEAKDRRIVTYCSVGYRSGAFARRLQAAGFAEVANLNGSIFRWANEGRPLVDEHGERCAKVHPYNRVWGLLLQRKYRAPLAPLVAHQ